MSKLHGLPRSWVLAACLFACMAGGCRQSPNPSTQPAKLSPQAQALVNQLLEVNRYESAAIGSGGSPSEIHEIFDALDQVATEAELRSLTNHENPVVRVYAFEGLVKRLGVGAVPVYLAHIDDNQYLQAQDGCLGGNRRVGDEMFGMIASESKQISGSQQAQIIEGLLQKSSKLRAKWDVLTNWAIPERLQAAVHEFALRVSAQDTVPYDDELCQKIEFLEKCLTEQESDAYLVKLLQADARDIERLNPFLLKHKPAAAVPILFKIVEDSALMPWERIEAVKTILGYEKPELTQRLKKMWKDRLIKVTGVQEDDPEDMATLRKLLE